MPAAFTEACQVNVFNQITGGKLKHREAGQFALGFRFGVQADTGIGVAHQYTVMPMIYAYSYRGNHMLVLKQHIVTSIGGNSTNSPFVQRGD